MKTNARVIWLLMLVALSIGTYAQRSADKPELKAFKVVSENGREVFKPAERANPGDVIEYRLECSNTSKAPFNNYMPVIPIPTGTEFIPNSATPASVTASADGVKFGAMPLKRSLVRDGVAAEDLLPLSQYKFLRWNLGTLAPGSSVTVKARVVVR